MKQISNGEVSSRTYYYLLDWNENDDWNFMQSQFSKIKLSELTLFEYQLLFERGN